MATIIDAIRHELRVMRERVNALEESLARLAPTYGDTPSTEETTPKRPPARRSRRVPSKRRAKGNPSQQEILDHVTARGPVGRRDILEALGGTTRALDHKLKSLLDNGHITAEGRPRRYMHAATAAAEAPAERPAASPLRRPDEGRFPVYDALVERGPSTTTELVDATGMTSKRVFAQARELVRLGLVRYTGTGSDRLWQRSSPAGSAA